MEAQKGTGALWLTSSGVDTPYSQAMWVMGCARSVSLYLSWGSSGYEASLCVHNLESEHGVVTYDDWLKYHSLSPPPMVIYGLCAL